MTESEFIEELSVRWPRLNPSEPTMRTIEIAGAAVAEHPGSAKLWTMRGNLIELADIEIGQPLREPERCYRQAIKVDPFFVEAYEDLAWFLDAVLGKRRKAKRFYDKARRLKRTARVMVNQSHEPTRVGKPPLAAQLQR